MITAIRNDNGITVSGHARYAPIGQDIVCAAVSTLAFSLIESVQKLTQDQIEFTYKSGENATIEIKHGNLSEAARLLVDSFFVGVEMIADEFPGHVRVL